MGPVYKIHRRIGAPMVFMGFSAQYIFYAGAAVLGALFLFAILFIAGLPNTWCVVVVFSTGLPVLGRVHFLSKKYGASGRRKKRDITRLPTGFRLNSRTIFINIKN